MRALPEEWDLNTTIIRNNTNLDDFPLDEIYGRLKTHDLEIQQRKNRKSTRTKSVALNSKANIVKSSQALLKRRSSMLKAVN